MLSWFIERRLAAFEKSFDYDMSYVREIAAAGPGALMKYVRAISLGDYRKNVSREAWHAARLVAIVAEDCDPCTQLAVTLAERDGVDPELIAALVAGRFDGLPEPVVVTARFTLATLKRSAEADALREQVVQHFGRLGLVSIVFGIVACRIYPTVKYALGYGKTCQQVTVRGKAVVPGARLKLNGAAQSSVPAEATVG